MNTTTIPPNHVVCPRCNGIGYRLGDETDSTCAECHGECHILNPLIEEWRTSTSPARMIELLGDKADGKRLLFFQQACRDEDCRQRPEIRPYTEPLSVREAWRWIRKDALFVSDSYRCNTIRCLFPNPHIARERVECPGCDGKMGGYIPARSGRTQEWIHCNGCKGLGTIEAPIIDPRWLSSTVLGLAKVIQGKESGWYCQNCNEECGTADFWCYCGDKSTRIKSLAEPSRPELMPALADALLDAGCDSEEVIEHCQSGGMHFGGCWVISEILKGPI